MQAEKGVLVQLLLKKLCDWNKFSDLKLRFLSSVGLLVFAYLFFIANFLVSSVLLTLIYAVLMYEWHVTSRQGKKLIDWLVFLFINIGILAFSLINALRYIDFFGSVVAFIPMIWVLLIAILTDIGAYFTGRIIGGYKPFVTISPAKTMSGYIGGLLCGSSVPLLTALLLQNKTPNMMKIGFLCFIGVCLSIASMAGDLLQSYFKRKNNVKDTGNILPGHGGLFDRFDGILGACVMMLIIFIGQNILERIS
jgi:phosphatidate cytidylyltransferase